jgi:TPR repeat protein
MLLVLAPALAGALEPPSPVAEEPAFTLLVAQAAAGDRESMLAVGRGYLAGRGTERDCYEARRWLKRAAGLESAEALFVLGLMDDNGDCGLAKADAAFAAYGAAAEKGHSGAQYRLGLLYQSGRGVDRDDELAYRWYAAAARNNEPLAWCGLADLYGKGAGVTRDLREARKWLRKGLRSGNPEAVERCNEVRAQTGLKE